MNTRSVFVAAVLACWAPAALAVDIPVASPGDVEDAMDDAQPGDVLVLADGTYTNTSFTFEGDGAPGNPITLRAETPGGVVLRGDSDLEIGGTYLVVEGFHFDGGALAEGGNIVRFRTGSRLASHCTLRNTAITNYNPASIGTRYFWVSLFGTDNVVEYCRFENQNHSGVTVCVWGSWPNRHIIRYNHFIDRPKGPENGWESVRIGTSSVVDESSETIVEFNRFERADGEVEAISNKSGNNVFRYNTFYETSATLTLRHGFSADVYGNFFLGNNVNGSGGVRVIGPGHRIWNNYFQDLDGRTEGIIALETGEPNAANSGYQPVTDVLIAHNTIVNCGEPAFVLDRSFGGDRTVLPTDVTLVGNLVSTPGQPVATGTNPNLTWSDNVAFASSVGTASGVSLLGSDPLTLGADGLHRLYTGSPAVDAVPTQTAPVTDDMDGQVRTALFDAGADELSADAITRRPVSAEDVGPAWWGSTNPGGDLDPDDGVFIEAETPTSILDPNNDNDVFTVLQVAEASEGAVLRAPAGSRTDLSSGPHDSIAIYTLTFPAAGSYTAYYRARSGSTSNDSFFTPDDFNTDPDVQEVTSSNGQFRWETGGTYEVTNPSTPAEFRIGKREQLCEIDLIVFYPSSGLSGEDLDALLAATEPCALDLDGDGELTFLDTLEYLRLFDAQDPAADRNSNGSIDDFDVVRWLQDVAAGC